jgi:hypothetical protein
MDLVLDLVRSGSPADPLSSTQKLHSFWDLIYYGSCQPIQPEVVFFQSCAVDDKAKYSNSLLVHASTI